MYEVLSGWYASWCLNVSFVSILSFSHQSGHLSSPLYRKIISVIGLHEEHSSWSILFVLGTNVILHSVNSFCVYSR